VGFARTRYGSYSAVPDPLVVIRERGGREGERKGWKYGAGCREGREWVGKDGNGRWEGTGRGRRGRKLKGEKGEGRLDLDICPGAPEFLVMPLILPL